MIDSDIPAPLQYYMHVIWKTSKITIMKKWLQNCSLCDLNEFII